jgi:hypothetical protein
MSAPVCQPVPMPHLTFVIAADITARRRSMMPVAAMIAVVMVVGERRKGGFHTAFVPASPIA